MIDEVEDLIRRQTQAWPLLASGIEGLARAQTRSVRLDRHEVFLRHLPHRIASTTAAVDRASIARRACFLCAANLPREEEGLPFGRDFMIYCNPYPIVEHHLTIASRTHRPQRIAGNFAAMLDLAATLPRYFVVYNGPECGASAPDHLHFQAGSRHLFPIEKDTVGQAGIVIPDYGRNVLMFRERDRAALIAKLDRVLELLSEFAPAAVTAELEPMVNLAVFHDHDQWVAYLFPRGKHRPEAFHRGELAVSPASIDLCGIVVIPRPTDFAKITADDVAKIFREVTLPDERFSRVVERLERGN